jgi:hypothetical protein
MSWVAAAVVGGAVVGGVATSNAAGKASKAQTSAAKTAAKTELDMFNMNRKDMKPWRDAGTAALARMVAGTKSGGMFDRAFTLADFQKDPGYQFRMNEGEQALERSAAARGGALSGRALKDIARFGQDYASGEYQSAYNRFNNDMTTRFNRLASLANTGQTATSDLAQIGTGVASRVGDTFMQAGNARASSYVANANAVNNGISTIGNYFMQRQALQPTTAAPAASTAPAYATGGWGSTGAGTTTYYG